MITVYKKKNALWIEPASKNGHAELEGNNDGYFHQTSTPASQLCTVRYRCWPLWVISDAQCFLSFGSEHTADVQLKLCHLHQMVFLIQLKRWNDRPFFHLDVWWSKNLSLQWVVLWFGPIQLKLCHLSYKQIFRFPSLDWPRRFKLTQGEFKLDFPCFFCIPGTCLCFGLGVERRPFPIKTRVIWLPSI